MPTDSTLADVPLAAAGPPSPWFKRAGLALLLLIVIAGGLGVFGVHARTIKVNSEGYELEVTYPQTARAGLDVPFRVRVHHRGGFAGPLTIRISSDYFRMFETQGFFPDADSVTNDGTFVSFRFARPPGATFLLEYDAYIQPSAQLGKSATVNIIVRRTTVASTSLHTWLAP